MQEHIVVSEPRAAPVEFELALEVGNDFADIFAVKAYDFALGDPEHAAPLPEPCARRSRPTTTSSSSPSSDNGFPAHPGRLLGARRGGRRLGPLPDRARAARALAAAGRRHPRDRRVRTAVQRAERGFGDELARVRASLTAWQLRVPQLRASWDDLSHSFRQSVADLASLRMDEDTARPGQLPAAGMPWFMTVFGRDTLITCLQTLLFGPELAQNALAVLAALQATEDDPEIGRRAGQDRPRGAPRQGRRGVVPALLRHASTRRRSTSILLSEVWRWTDDAALVRDLREPALRALSGSTSTATSTATASSSTSAARSAGS